MTSSLWSITIFLAVSLYASFAFAAKCYSPDGSPVQDDDFQPCVSISGVESMCCATNRDFLPDTCLANGLCHNPCKNEGDCSNIPGRYWREHCTDPSWNSPFCLKEICTNADDENGSTNGTATLSQCATDGRWCCGDLTSEACCALDSRFFLSATVGASSTTSKISIKSTSSIINQGPANSHSTFGSASTSISSSISISTPTPTPTPTPTSTPSTSHSHTGKAAGLGAGVGIGVLLVGIVVCWFVIRRRRARKNQYERRPAELDHDMAYDGMPKYGSNGKHLAQLGDERMLATPEMDGASTPEMDGASTPEMDGASTPEMDGASTPELDGTSTHELDGNEHPRDR